jgi:hypothetical protein
MIRSSFVWLGAALLAAAPVSARAAASIEDTCQSAKHKTAASYTKCSQQAESKFLLTGDAGARTAALDLCTAKFGTKWSAAEDKAAARGGACQTTGDQATVLDAIDDHVECTVEALAGGSACVTCGDGVVDPQEDCDFGDLGGATCSSATAGALDMGELDCAAGCAFDTSGCFSCAGLGGVIVAGSCWFLGATAASCLNTCVAEGLAYDPATLTYAGSAGTDPNCEAVLAALGYVGAPVTTTSSSGVGCAISSGAGVRDTAATTSAATATGVQRACACGE